MTSKYVIKEVWSSNLLEEFKVIRQAYHSYKYVAMDTEFPGVVAHPVGDFASPAEYQYQLLKCNVDQLRLIQLGITLISESSSTLPILSWQFNFKFNIHKDTYAQDSIEMLINSGFEFEKHETDGIEHDLFAELLITSGLILFDNLTWLCFHGCYDFGYLLRMLSGSKLPDEESEFFDILKLYFPKFLDVKIILRGTAYKGGLQEVAGQLHVQRIGIQHQAGSDSILTGEIFFKLSLLFPDEGIPVPKYVGSLYGLGEFTPRAGPSLSPSF